MIFFFFFLVCKYLLVLNLMTATHAEQVGEVGSREPGRLWNAPESPVWNIPGVNRFIGNRCWQCGRAKTGHLLKARPFRAKGQMKRERQRVNAEALV